MAEIEAGQYLKRELTKIACGTYQGETDLAKLVAEWKTPWGIELCKKCQFPTAEFFERYENELLSHGVFRNQKGMQLYNRDVVLVNSEAIIEYALPNRAHTVLLYHGSTAVIKATVCSVVKVYNITQDNKVYIDSSDNATVILR